MTAPRGPSPAVEAENGIVMANRQSRRTVSLAASVYIAARSAAYQRGVTLSQFVVDALRAVLPLPATHHQTPDQADKMRRGKVRAHHG